MLKRTTPVSGYNWPTPIVHVGLHECISEIRTEKRHQSPARVEVRRSAGLRLAYISPIENVRFIRRRLIVQSTAPRKFALDTRRRQMHKLEAEQRDRIGRDKMAR